MSKSSQLQSSKKMALALRHSPETFNLSLKGDGSTSILELAEALKLSEGLIREIVAEDTKQRFVIQGDRVWAAQGHTIPVTPPLLKFVSKAPLFHGTSRKFLESILDEGLKPMARNFVHLSQTVREATIVASRRKNSEVVILTIDTERLVSEGFELFEASNGVVLAKSVPAKFIIEMD